MLHVRALNNVVYLYDKWAGIALATGWTVRGSNPSGRRDFSLPSRPALGGPQGRSGRVRNISPPPGFDPRTVQPVAIRYTD